MKNYISLSANMSYILSKSCDNFVNTFLKKTKL